MSAETVVFVIDALFIAFGLALVGVLVWVHYNPDAHDETLIEDFMYIERRKRIADRRAKRRSPESNGRRKGDQ